MVKCTLHTQIYFMIRDKNLLLYIFLFSFLYLTLKFIQATENVAAKKQKVSFSI